MPTKWCFWSWDRPHAARAIVREARQNALIFSLRWLEVKDCNENRYEGGHGRCRQNGIFGLGITRMQRAKLCAKRARTHLFAVYGGWKWRIAMKIGMKGDMGVADKMVFLVLGLSACSARNCKQSAPERTYSQLMVARSEGLLLVLGLSAHICARIASECTCLQFMVARSEGLQ